MLRYRQQSGDILLTIPSAIQANDAPDHHHRFSESESETNTKKATVYLLDSRLF